MSAAVLTMTSRTSSDGHVLIELVGRFDAHETEALRVLVDEVLSTGASSIVFSLSEVNFIDSTGLAELVRTMKGCRERGGEVILDGVSNAVRIILELTKLDAAFTLR